MDRISEDDMLNVSNFIVVHVHVYLQVVREGELKIIPEMHKKTWYNWLENNR